MMLHEIVQRGPHSAGVFFKHFESHSLLPERDWRTDGWMLIDVLLLDPKDLNRRIH